MRVAAHSRRVLRSGCERLVVEWRRDRLLDDDEGMLGNLMTGVAGGRQLVKGAGEFETIARPDGFAELCDFVVVKRADGWRYRYVVDYGKQLRDIREALFQTVKLVLCQFPIICGGREPELGVADLLHGHDIAKPRRVRPFGCRVDHAVMLRLRSRMRQRGGKREQEWYRHPSHRRLRTPAQGTACTKPRAIFEARRKRGGISEFFDPWPQLHLRCPGASRLMNDMQISSRDRVRIEQARWLIARFRTARALDAAVDH